MGPYDLSHPYVPGEFQHERVVEALQEITRVSKQLNARAGYHVVPPDPDQVIQKIDEGYMFIAYSVDSLSRRIMPQWFAEYPDI